MGGTRCIFSLYSRSKIDRPPRILRNSYLGGTWGSAKVGRVVPGSPWSLCPVVFPPSSPYWVRDDDDDEAVALAGKAEATSRCSPALLSHHRPLVLCKSSAAYRYWASCKDVAAHAKSCRRLHLSTVSYACSRAYWQPDISEGKKSVVLSDMSESPPLPPDPALSLDLGRRLARSFQICEPHRCSKIAVVELVYFLAPGFIWAANML